MARIINVSGLNNNCGPHVFLHMLCDHWDDLPFESPTFEGLLNEIGQAYSIAPTRENIKTLIDGLSYLDREVVLGPVIRAHMAQVFEGNAELKKRLFESSFLPMLRNYLEDRRIEAVEDKIFYPNKKYFDEIKVNFREWAQAQEGTPEEQIDAFLELISEGPNASKAYWDNTGFKNTMGYVGHPFKSYMMTMEDMQRYAAHLNIELEVFLHGQRQQNPEPVEDPIFKMAVHNTGAHWTYQACDQLEQSEIDARNATLHDIAPGDRDLTLKCGITAPQSPQTQKTIFETVMRLCGQSLLNETSKLIHWVYSKDRSDKAQRFFRVQEELNTLLDEQGDMQNDRFEQIFNAAEKAITEDDSQDFQAIRRQAR